MSIVAIASRVLLAGSLTTTAHKAGKGINYTRKAALDKWHPKPKKVKTGIFRHEYRTRLGKKCDKRGVVKPCKKTAKAKARAKNNRGWF